ncbi:TIGR02281 family clan AA aspartic protease [Lutibacter sp. B1]|uniref:retropepsin-like aspartic protease family protein n=1 Tax=Lutibacter sp. B1 TaxID=2725996 RepID=UPI0014563B20|nr:retropepsin-like aspartic protease [Lutibacter sp. B1]NLP59326.1 TIGR02281 family clan AA aspartic protease [Lutibacter sp. B1]
MEKVNGVYQIPCKVNGIEMKFIFDTGASDISISKTEANFLAKQGLLKEEDIIGTQKYQIADGSISEGTKIIIREIKIKDIFIRDVSATVIDNDNAPLLFGQSALSKFGRFEIERNILRIYSKGNRNNYEFLGIDLTKTIDDFGLSRVNLVDAKPVLGIPFDACKVSKEHELKDFGFEKQSLVFDKEGNIFMVGLTKEAEGEYNFEKEKYAKDFFENLYETMSVKFGSSESKMSKSAQWKTRNFELLMNIESDYKIGLFYIPKIFINQDLVMGEGKQEKEFKKNKKPSPEEMAKFDEKIRKDLAEMTTLAYQTAPIDKKWKLNAYSKNEILFISMERDRMDIRPSLEANSQKRKIKNLEKVTSKDLAYLVYKNYIATNDEKNLKFLSELYKEIRFDYYFSYIDGTSSEVNFSILSEEMLKIGIPVIKRKFDTYCN